MPLIQPASVLLSDQAGISVGRSAATPNAPISAQAWATHITTTARFTRETAGIRQRRRQGSASRGHIRYLSAPIVTTSLLPDRTLNSTQGRTGPHRKRTRLVGHPSPACGVRWPE